MDNLEEIQRPNIFEISTKELTQDAFITWLLQWADEKYVNLDINLNNCGKDFVNKLIQKTYPDFNEKIEKVIAGRQWNNIDVWAKINDKYLIIIEDKTLTGQHSGQIQIRRLKITAVSSLQDCHVSARGIAPSSIERVATSLNGWDRTMSF